MEEAFGIVIFSVVIVGFLISIATLFNRSSVYDEIGKGGLETSVPVAEESSAVAAAEIRQMLEARNDRRVRKGQEPLDIEAELARLTATTIDPGLEAEVRSLVIARNDRRVRRGKEPLDVDAEVARQLAELSG